MTVPTTTGALVTAEVIATVVDAATAAAQKLPTTAPLTAGQPITDPAVPVLPPGDGAAVLAAFGPMGSGGEIVIVVADDVVNALATSPLGKLELAPALQPALDAAAATFDSGLMADPAREMEPEAALGGLAGAGYVAVPLLAGDEHRATFAVLVAAPGGPVAASRTAPSPAARQRGLELLRDVEMEVTVELGRTRMTVRELLTLTPGAVVELDRAAGSPADLLVNGTLIARGEIVVVDEDFGIRITEIVAATGETPA